MAVPVHCSLGYSDVTCPGFYDIWGCLTLELRVSTGSTNFPALDSLAQIPYVPGDIREVVVFDETHDPRLAQLKQDAGAAIAANKHRGRLECVKVQKKRLSHIESVQQCLIVACCSIKFSPAVSSY